MDALFEIEDRADLDVVYVLLWAQSDPNWAEWNQPIIDVAHKRFNARKEAAIKRFASLLKEQADE
jgi:hypothetical protein